MLPCHAERSGQTGLIHLTFMVLDNRALPLPTCPMKHLKPNVLQLACSTAKVQRQDSLSWHPGKAQ